MLKQKVNITAFKENLDDLIELVMNGDEIIITKSETPIAKITPVQNKKLNISENIISMKAMDNKRISKSEAPENWFG